MTYRKSVLALVDGSAIEFDVGVSTIALPRMVELILAPLTAVRAISPYGVVGGLWSTSGSFGRSLTGRPNAREMVM